MNSASAKRIAGVDEAGRGPLAGPVVAAACILPQRSGICGIADSKKLSREERKRLYAELKAHNRVILGLGIVHAELIDTLNILQATLKAMREAIAQVEPDYVLIDGPHHPDPSIPGETLIRGESRSLAIAAASIIAKEARDQMMEEYHKQWPQYGFDQHKGYPTQQHVAAIEKYGLCPIHRRSFRIPQRGRRRDPQTQSLQECD